MPSVVKSSGILPLVNDSLSFPGADSWAEGLIHPAPRSRGCTASPVLPCSPSEGKMEKPEEAARAGVMVGSAFR